MLTRLPSRQRPALMNSAPGDSKAGWPANNLHGAFDGLRLIAVTCVLFSHSYALVAQDAKEPLVALTGGATAIRELAVYAFFAISGYLVF